MVVGGTTGKPKGILHTTGGYLVHVTTTAKAIFAWHVNIVSACK